MIPRGRLGVVDTPNGLRWLVCCGGRCQLAASGADAARLYRLLRRQVVTTCEPIARRPDDRNAVL